MKYIFPCIFCLIVVPVFSQVEYAKGYVFDPEEYEKVPIKANLTRGDYDDIPSSHTLKSFCPKPGNQLQKQTSTNWAASYGALTILEARKNNLTDRKEITRNTFSPVFSYAIGTHLDNNNCEVPVSLITVLEALKNYGSPRYIDFLEFCPTSIPENIYNLAREHRITDYVRLFEIKDPPETKITAVKKALAEGMPVIVGMLCPPSFQIAKEFWQPREKIDPSFEGHALTVIGYDDSKYGGAFELLNSWGSQWGNDGFIWIRYNDFVEFTLSAFELFIIDQDNSIDFSGEIKIVLKDGNIVPTKFTGSKGYYETEIPFQTGTNFRIYITNNKTAYVYVFGTDLTNDFFNLFPLNPNTSPVLNYHHGTVALPSEKHHISITGDPGKNFLVILYSKEEIAIPSLIKQLESSNGRIDMRIESVMKDYIVSEDNIEWEDDKIKFSAKGNGKTLVPVYIEMPHN